MSIDLDMDTIPCKADSIIVRRVKDEDYLVKRNTQMGLEEKLWVLNPTASFIWARIDGRRKCGDILKELMERFDANADLIKQDFISLLLQLKEQGLLIMAPNASPDE